MKINGTRIFTNALPQRPRNEHIRNHPQTNAHHHTFQRKYEHALLYLNEIIFRKGCLQTNK
jgi:hypothetical protein